MRFRPYWPDTRERSPSCAPSYGGVPLDRGSVLFAETPATHESAAGSTFRADHETGIIQNRDLATARHVPKHICMTMIAHIK